MALSLGVMAVAVVAYPMLQAIVMRWWLEGLRIGPLAVATTLRKRSIIGAYLRCFLYAVPLAIVLSIVMSLAIGICGGHEAARRRRPARDGRFGPRRLSRHGARLSGRSTRRPSNCGYGGWRSTSISLAGFEAIAYVRADASLPSSAVGEGLADALGAGGF